MPARHSHTARCKEKVAGHPATDHPANVCKLQIQEGGASVTGAHCLPVLLQVLLRPCQALHPPAARNDPQTADAVLQAGCQLIPAAPGTAPAPAAALHMTNGSSTHMQGRIRQCQCGSSQQEAPCQCIVLLLPAQQNSCATAVADIKASETRGRRLVDNSDAPAVETSLACSMPAAGLAGLSTATCCCACRALLLHTSRLAACSKGSGC